MKRLSAAWGIVVVLALGNQALGQGRRPLGPPVGRPPINYGAINGRTVVIVVEGVSSVSDTAGNLETAYQDSFYSKPLITLINWTRTDMPQYDYRDWDAQSCAALRVLAEVKRIHQISPASPIVLMGYCAGAHVVLLAAQQMPPGYVDRIFLLSAAVSSFYDLRPALRASKLGVDAIFSSDDSLLQFYETEYGTADGHRTTTAGTTGFIIPPAIARDPIFCNFRQADASQIGAIGGHYAVIGPYFMRCNVIPLIPCGAVLAVPPPLPPGGPVPPPGPPPGLPAPPYTPPLPPGPGGPVPPPTPPVPPYGMQGAPPAAPIPPIPPIRSGLAAPPLLPAPPGPLGPYGQGSPPAPPVSTSQTATSSRAPLPNPPPPAPPVSSTQPLLPPPN